MPLIAWRLRNVGETRSRLLMEGLHTCANCHSFSRDGKTLGMDVDGPQNDKGLYAIVPIQPHMSIRNEDVITWSSFRGKLGGKLRVGFMSQVSPDGQYVVTTINDPGVDRSEYERRRNPRTWINYYVANFKDYRFLQVFYPTRGILAWYSRADRPAAAAARRRRSALRADERRLEPGRQVPGLCPGRSEGRLSRGREAGRVRQRSERDPDPVRPLPDPLQRRQGRPRRNRSPAPRGTA